MAHNGTHETVRRWRAIPGYKGLYEINRKGDVRSNITGKILKQNVRGKYLSVNLSKCGSKSFNVHRLVIIAFKGLRKGLSVNHKNGKKTDNRLSNLEWSTQSEQQLHAYRTGLQKPSAKQKKAVADFCRARFGKPVIKLTVNGVMISQYPSTAEAARSTNSTQSSISKCCNGKLKTHNGYCWKYAQ